MEFKPDNGRNLDLLADACARFKREGMRGVDWTFFNMSAQERLDFDCFLVRMKDPLAYEAGTTEYRFKTRVERMVRQQEAFDLQTKLYMAEEQGRKEARRAMRKGK